MLPAGILAIIKEEWIAHHVDAREVDAIARRETRGRFFVCAIIGEGESDEPTRSAYRSLGYRLLATEGFFVQRLKRIPKSSSPAPIGPTRRLVSPVFRVLREVDRRSRIASAEMWRII